MSEDIELPISEKAANPQEPEQPEVDERVKEVNEKKPEDLDELVDVLEGNDGGEAIRQETKEELCAVMQKLPRMGESLAFQIPYRSERQMPAAILDEETGLEVEAAYNPGGKHSSLRPSPGLTIVLSTPSLKEGKNTSVHLDQMVDALQRIYGESPNLEDEIGHIRNVISSNSLYDRVKFELFSDEGGPVLNGFSITSGKARVPIDWWAKTPHRPVSESGGHFLKEILERVAQKQFEEAEDNRLLTDLVIEKVKDEAIPNDDSKVYEYAYHGTRRDNISSISESGLQPSGSESKEPGTIFFTGWDSATVAVPEGKYGEGALYRFHIDDMPEIAKSWDISSEEGLRGIGNSLSTHIPVSPDKLDFSVDKGKTWMPAVHRVKQAD